MKLLWKTIIQWSLFSKRVYILEKCTFFIKHNMMLIIGKKEHVCSFERLPSLQMSMWIIHAFGTYSLVVHPQLILYSSFVITPFQAYCAWWFLCNMETLGNLCKVLMKLDIYCLIKYFIKRLLRLTWDNYMRPVKSNTRQYIRFTQANIISNSVSVSAPAKTRKLTIF